VITLVGMPVALVGIVTATVLGIAAAIPTSVGTQTSSVAAVTASVPITAGAASAVAYARAQLGKPYQWGGAGPDAFDCSGLTQAAWKAAGVTIARTSEEQWQTLPHIPLDALLPGDLVFFNDGEFRPSLPGHVGIYIGNAAYIDAPHTGARIRVDQLNQTQRVVGAARPIAAGMGPTRPRGRPR